MFLGPVCFENPFTRMISSLKYKCPPLPGALGYKMDIIGPTFHGPSKYTLNTIWYGPAIWLTCKNNFQVWLALPKSKCFENQPTPKMRIFTWDSSYGHTLCHNMMLSKPTYTFFLIFAVFIRDPLQVHFVLTNKQKQTRYMIGLPSNFLLFLHEHDNTHHWIQVHPLPRYATQ